MVYFDYAASTPLDKEIYEKYIKLLAQYFANSESIHSFGSDVSKILEASRKKTASLLGVKPKEIIFTSGASEANSFAIKGYSLAHRDKGMHLITTKIEHTSVINSFKQLEKEFGFEVTYLDVDQNGVINLEQLKNSLRKDTILVSIMAVNNETGTIEPIEEVKKILKDYPTTKLHVDCVQAVGKIDLDLKGIDFISVGAHKINGLKGSGILYKKENCDLLPLISGGNQEFGIRGGTTNAMNYAVFGDTLEKCLNERKEHLEIVTKLNQQLRNELSLVDGVIINSPSDASPYILNISVPCLPSQIQMNALNEKGYAVSAHSTCDSNDAHSFVLEAMGITGKRLDSAVRISLSANTTPQEVNGLVEAIKENIKEYGIR